MTTDPAAIGHLDDDARFELAMAAGSRERRNRPRHLVVFALLVFIAALITFALGLSRQASATTAMRADVRRHADVVALVAQLKDYRERAAAMGSVGAFDPMPVVTTLQRLFSEAGMTRSLSPPQESSQQQRATEGALIVKTYDYRNLQSPELAPLMRWIELAHQQIPGLGVSKVDLQVGPAGWTLNISFTRAERAPA